MRKTLKIRVFSITPSVGRKYASIEGACQNISLFISCYTLFIIFSDELTRLVILNLFCHLTECGGVHACSVSVADVDCFDDLGKEVATLDAVADCRFYMRGYN